MNNKVLTQALEYKWDQWLKRNFYAFMMSLFLGSGTKQTFRKIGLSGWELKSFIFSQGYWYWSDKIFNMAVPTLRDWLKRHQISEISDSLEKFHQQSLARIAVLNSDKKLNLQEKLEILEDILRESSAYIWSAHMLEHVVWEELKKKTPKYIKSDLDKYIGDAAYPEKKNMLELMETEMRGGVSLKEIHQKYSWMRCRDGFTRPYTLKELAEHKKQLKKHAPHVYPIIPKPLRKIYQQAQELVYLRTRRTDVFYELIFTARPILQATAKKYNLKFSNLKYYSLQDLISGKLRKYSNHISYVEFGGRAFISDEPIFTQSEIDKTVTEIKGSIAQMGVAQGIAKVILSIKEVAKVQKGDILVTYMTSPDFLQAMKKAAAFVTNEGGLTCHAAIIARELKKPCVIGTKIATKAIKDGDLLEVDANKGIVKILKRATK